MTRKKRLRCIRLLLLLPAVTLSLSFQHVHAQDEQEAPSGWWQAIEDNLDYDFKCLVQGTHAAPPSSSRWGQNPRVYLTRYSAALNLRPNVRFRQDALTLLLKPRYDLTYQVLENNENDRIEEDEEEFYINEWLARLRLSPQAFVSYGRENLQWGGAYLFSPSNPFFTDNGQRNPKKEVEGMDFARLVVIPSLAWSLSVIAHLDDGNQKLGATFQKAYALKADYNADEYYLSGIVSYRDRHGTRLGFYGGRTCTDALLVYLEGALGDQRAMFYPLAADDFTGAAALSNDLDGSTWTGSILTGASYTLEAGPTLTAEYLYSGIGDTLDRHSARLLDQRRSADFTFFENSHYVLLQYTHNEIAEVFDLILRYTHGLDDGSGQLTTIAEYDLSDHVVLFGIGTTNRGTQDTEYGQLLDYQVIIGVEYTY